jgi:cutinase
VNLYPVDYPSTNDYVNSAHAGADDAVAHVQGTAASCPKTKIVLGGYSQGAGVMDMTSHRLSPQVANRVAAVALFGNPQSSYAKSLSDSQIPAIDPGYSPKTIEICLPNDNICAEGGSIIAHLGYIPDATNQAATFVAQKL